MRRRWYRIDGGGDEPAWWNCTVGDWWLVVGRSSSKQGDEEP